MIKYHKDTDHAGMFRDPGVMCKYSEPNYLNNTLAKSHTRKHKGMIQSRFHTRALRNTT